MALESIFPETLRSPFFRAIYRRINFSPESIEQTFNGTVNFGKKVTCTHISRNGLINRMYLRCDLPRSVPETLGHGPQGAGSTTSATLSARWRSRDGGQKIDKHYGEWLHIWNELTRPPATRLATVHDRKPPHLHQLQVRPRGCCLTTCVDANTLYIPLRFWFCRSPGLLPLIALQYHEVKIALSSATPASSSSRDANYVIDGELGATLYRLCLSRHGRAPSVRSGNPSTSSSSFSSLGLNLFP
jgi:hypothetical protein